MKVMHTTPHKPLIRARVVIPLLLLAIGWWYGLASYVAADNAAQVAHSERRVIERKEHLALIAELTAKRLKREAHERKVTADKLTSALVAGTLPKDLAKLPCNHGRTHVDPTELGVLVNKQHCIRPLNYVPKDLTSDSEVTLARPAYEAYYQMKQAATRQGASFVPTSSYRSFDLQITSYTDWYRTLGSVERANEVSALPGYSEHQLGLAVDFRAGGCALECFRSTSAYKWLRTHAHEYGFIERYPRGKEDVTGYGAEAWHWRYVGEDVATDMRAQKVLTLEEYYDMPGGRL